MISDSILHPHEKTCAINFWNDSMRNSTDPFSNETGINIFFSQVYGNGFKSKQQIKKHLLLKNLYKFIRKARLCSIWTKLLLPFPFSQSIRWRLHSRLLSKNTGISLYPAPSWKIFFQGRADLQPFSSYFQLSVAEANFWVSGL